MKRLFFAGSLVVAALLAALVPVGAQGGAFVPSLDYSVSGAWTFASAPTVTGAGTVVSTTATQTLTNKTIATITNTGTLTLPSATGGLPVALNCGATGVGNQTCSPTAATALTKVYSGSSTLSSNNAVITFPTAFAATTSYQCVASNITTRGNHVHMISTSTTTATITNTLGASDVINWVCVGQ